MGAKTKVLHLYFCSVYLKLNESLLIECTVEKNRVPFAEIQLEPWLKLLSSGWVLDVDGAPMVANASDQQKLQHPLVTMQACFRHRIKK